MIEIIEGRGVGSGKSYYTCTRIVQHLKAGGTIWATDSFGLKWPECRAYMADRHGVEVEDDQFTVFARKDTTRLHELVPQGAEDCPVLAILDEAHMELNARDWNDKGRRAFFDWLSQSRHDDVDVIFISQNAFNLDTQVRRLVTYIIRCRNLKNFEFPGIGNLLHWLGLDNRFTVARYDQDGRTMFRKDYVPHDPEIFGIYKSKQMRGAHRRMSYQVSRKNLRRSKSVKRPKTMGKILLLVVVVMAIFFGYRLTSGHDLPKGAALSSSFATGAPGLRPGNLSGQAAAAYELYDEEFKSFYGPSGTLRTDGGEYQVGEMSNKGWVVAVSATRARVQTPQGVPGWVVARNKPNTTGLSQPAAPTPPPPTPAPLATPAPKLADADGKPKHRSKAVDMRRALAGLAPTEEEQDAIYDRQAGNPPKDQDQ